jgi:hypothetical protein
MGYCASQQDWQPDFRSGSKARITALQQQQPLHLNQQTS